MLSARSLTFSHGGAPLLREANLTVDDGARIALVGKNGAGKSTLLSLLAGELTPDSGNVERGRGQTIGFLRQTPQLDPEARVLDVAAEALGDVTRLIAEHARLCAEQPDDPRVVDLVAAIEDRGGFDQQHRVDEVLHRLGVDVRAEKVGALSGGGRRRLDLARLLLRRPDVLLLDEPTNHLDVQGIEFLADELRRHRGSAVIVSHDRAFIDDVATQLVELEQGELYAYPPPDAAQHLTLTGAYLEHKLVRDEQRASSAHKRQRLFVRELAWLRAGTPARTTKQQARIQRANALLDEVDREERSIRERKAKVALVIEDNKRLGRTILDFQDVSLARAGRTILEGLSLAVTPGMRLGIVGENGVGKTTILAAVLHACGAGSERDGQVVVARGKLVVGAHTDVAVFDQHKAHLDDEATLEEVLAGHNDHVLIGDERMHIAGYLERFLFDGSDRYRRVKTLSGGQKSRLVLARLFQQGKNCLLLDEPTNDLDVETLGVLEDALLDHAGVALIVSHDRRFLDRVATHILAVDKIAEDRPARCTVYVGDYSTYATLSRAATAAAAAPAPTTSASTSTSAPAPTAPAKTKKKRSYKEEQEFGGIEDRIQTLEARRDEVRALLSDGDVFRTDPPRARALQAELTQLDADVEAGYARWQELSELAPM